MANVTRQVQPLKQSIRRVRNTTKSNLAAANLPARRYPGETAGKYLSERLNQLSPTSIDRMALTAALIVLREYEKAEAKGDTTACERLLRRRGFRNPRFWLKHLYATAGEQSSEKRRVLVHGIHEDGLVIAPSTTRGKDAFALLSLEAQGKLTRVLMCYQCKRFFYARFKHQGFCSTKCQGDHYHSPEWRRQNRERNKRHQRKYRDRYFGKKRFEPLGKPQKPPK